MKLLRVLCLVVCITILFSTSVFATTVTDSATVSGYIGSSTVSARLTSQGQIWPLADYGDANTSSTRSVQLSVAVTVYMQNGTSRGANSSTQQGTSVTATAFTSGSEGSWSSSNHNQTSYDWGSWTKSLAASF